MKISIEEDKVTITITEDCGHYTNTIETFRLRNSMIPNSGDIITTSASFDKFKVIHREFHFEKGELFSVKVVVKKV